MKNNCISYLVQEHDIISSVEGLVLKINRLWINDSEMYTNVINDLLIFLREYSDQYHHHKEEDILFPRLKKLPDFRSHEMLDELEDHHVQFREHTRDIDQAIAQKDFDKTQTILTKYVDELLDHIAVENDELFVLAESLFEPEEIEEMFFLFKDVDMELGEEKKQDLEASLSRLVESLDA